MASRTCKLLHRLAVVTLAVSLFGCRVQTVHPSTPPPAATPSAPPATAPAPEAATQTRAAPPAVPTLPETVTPTLAVVTITAVNGNLYIRRGSGSDFNPIGVLAQGQTVTAAGRDILDEWLYIPIPSQAGRFGWVSMQTIYSSISGHTMDLPVVDSDLAVPAFIQNCSTHNMLVQPSGVIIPPGIQFPDNIVQFDPGEYTIHDYDSPNKNNQGLVIDLKEGEQYQITAMGTPAQHKCPDGQ
ncbi:MAG TPA: SH3 domain-containing protein [Anaerolineales bacterium]|nr:SH3 domain-containing protein [Anaerolineales bacterium]